MNCPNCNIEILHLKKNQYLRCKCGKDVMLVEINKKKELVVLEDKGEKQMENVLLNIIDTVLDAPEEEEK